MNTKQLHKFCVQNPVTRNKFKGVMAKNHLPKEMKGFIIVNTDNCHQPGQHWVVLWCHNNQCEYFNSSGQPPKGRIKEAALRYGKGHYTYNKKTVQREGTETCGQFCLYYCFHKCKNRNMESIVERVNESKVKHFYKVYSGT